MPIVDDVSPDILQPLFPLLKNLNPAWNHIVTGVARAPDSALAEAAVQITYAYTRAQLTVDYGEAVVEEEAAWRPIEFVVLGMGKLRGEELNFSSDIDLIYLYECDAGMTTGGRKGQMNASTFVTTLAQNLTRTLSMPIAGGIVFRVDLRLRPDGTNGQIVDSLSNTLLCYESWGQT